ncbi:hypothetical protein FSP39_011502 [Pinctada imbricata]|uniref:TIR domain-containing protein n=1 Tax=Pinctada imbricata TaxID=66713 RepID=A0AA88XFV5_PINIB|nr:hypothetical protein FSP39_011502 [Pinctada imbricata]
MGSKPSHHKQTTQSVPEHNDLSSPKKEQPKDSQGAKNKPLLERNDSNAPRDLMISYSHADKEMMQKIRDKLEENRISVWVDVIGLSAGVDFLSKIGQAILDAKLIISLLSTSTCKSKYCQDEVALAYISQKPIFPVAISPVEELFKVMDTGMKLQLANVDWTIFKDPENFESDFQELLTKLNSELEDQNNLANLGEKGTKRLKQMENKVKSKRTSAPLAKLVILPEEYWKEIFFSDFKNYFSEQISSTFTIDDMTWLTQNLQAEMENETDKTSLYKVNFITFFTVDGEQQAVWPRVEDYTKEIYAMHEILSMDSNVRVDAIENLGRYQSPAVISSLRDLLRSKESNIRAVTAVSLAKTGNKDKQTIDHLMKLLSDKDRLVREAGCLALGHLQAKVAIPKLLHLWQVLLISTFNFSTLHMS